MQEFHLKIFCGNPFHYSISGESLTVTTYDKYNYNILPTQIMEIAGYHFSAAQAELGVHDRLHLRQNLAETQRPTVRPARQNLAETQRRRGQRYAQPGKISQRRRGQRYAHLRQNLAETQRRRDAETQRRRGQRYARLRQNLAETQRRREKAAAISAREAADAPCVQLGVHPVAPKGTEVPEKKSFSGRS